MSVPGSVLLCVSYVLLEFIPSLLSPSLAGYSGKIQIIVFQCVVGPCGSEFVLNLPLLLRPSASIRYLSLSAQLS